MKIIVYYIIGYIRFINLVIITMYLLAKKKKSFLFANILFFNQ